MFPCVLTGVYGFLTIRFEDTSILDFIRYGEGYLTKQSIEAMRSELAHDIFRQDFANIYEEQAQSRILSKSRSFPRTPLYIQPVPSM